MKAVINEKVVPTRYPWIGKLKSTETILVVLFYGLDSGIVIESTSPDWKIVGQNYTNWAEHEFTPFTGSITLSND